MTYTTLREARLCVMRKVEFTGNNVYGRWLTDDDTRHSWYVVYSYGTHFPMYIFDETMGVWAGNKDKYSPTTSRHQSACCPPNIGYWFDTNIMKRIELHGLHGVIANRIGVAA